MKFKYLSLLIIALIAIFASCKKESSPITGKWQEVKMRVYKQNINTSAISGDTTYQANTFGSLDYAQFNSNGTCMLSQGGQYFTSTQPIAFQDITNYTFLRLGSGFALTKVTHDPTVNTTSGTTDTVSSFSSDELTIHSVISYVDHSITYKTIVDSYYTK